MGNNFLDRNGGGKSVTNRCRLHAHLDGETDAASVREDRVEGSDTGQDESRISACRNAESDGPNVVFPKVSHSDPDDGDSVLTDTDVANLNAVLGHQISENTKKNYAAQWRRFSRWATRRGVNAVPAHPAQVAAYLAERMELHGHKPATLRAAAAAVSYVHRNANLDDPCAEPDVKNMLRSAVRKAGLDQRQAQALTAEDLLKIRNTAHIPRIGRGGRVETPEGATKRAALDIAMISLMRDAMLRVSEAASLRWEDLAVEEDGSGRLIIRRSKTDAEGETVVLFVSPPTMSALEAIRGGADPQDSMFQLNINQIIRRIKQAAMSAGLGDGYSGHSPRVGMAQDLARIGIELPRLMTAGRWRSPRMPAHYIRNETAARGAVAQYYGLKIDGASTVNSGVADNPGVAECDEVLNPHTACLNELCEMCTLTSQDDGVRVAFPTENQAKSCITATIEPTESSTLSATESRRETTKRNRRQDWSRGIESVTQKIINFSVKFGSILTRSGFESQSSRRRALETRFDIPVRRPHPLLETVTILGARPAIRFLLLRFLPLAAFIVVAGHALWFLDWSGTGAPVAYVALVVSTVLAHTYLFPDRDAQLREFYWTTVFIALTTPLLQFAPISADHYGFYTITDVSDSHAPYTLALLANLFIAMSAGQMFHLLRERVWTTGEGKGDAVRQAATIVVPPMCVVSGIVLVISNAAVWIQIALVLPFASLAFMILLVLRDPSMAFSERDRQLVWTATLTTIAVCHALGIVVILTSYASPGLSQILPDHNLLRSWEIDFAERGYSREDALDRLKLGYLLHATVQFVYMASVLGGNVVVAVFRMGREDSRSVVNGEPSSATARAGTNEEPPLEETAENYRRFSLRGARFRILALLHREAESWPSPRF